MKKKNFLLNNKEFLHGFIVKAHKGLNKNPQFALPKIPNDCLIIFPKDITGSNIIEINKQNIPFFASSKISYIGQPLYAIFAPSLEQAELLASEIKISYLEIEEENQNPVKDITFSYKQGDYDKIESEIFELINSNNNEENEDSDKFSNFKSSITFDRISAPIQKSSKIIVELEEDLLNIYSQTQWPQLIINNVSNICGYNKKKIIVNKEDSYSIKDEYLIEPAVFASVAALAAIKTNKIIFLHTIIKNSRAKIQIEKETLVDVTKKSTIIEKVNVIVNQGTTSILQDEISKQLIAGLIPLYKLKALIINFTFTHSPETPAIFFGGLGYENALAATQIHTSKLGRFFDISPYLWMQKTLYDSPIFKKAVTINNLQKPKDILSNLIDDSFYNRKYAAYKVNSAHDRSISTFTPYARGIGLAIGPSISGFSLNNENFSLPRVNLTLNFDGTAELNTSFYNNSQVSDLWKDIIYNELEVEKEKITFCDNSQEIVDSGPCTLSLNSKIMSDQIKLACQKINDRRFLEGLPISVNLGGSKKPAKTSLFNSDTWIALIMEVSIDSISLEPIVSSISANCVVGKIVNETVYKRNMKIEILNTLDELGANFAKGGNLKIDIKLNQINENISDSITQGLKGVVIAAFNIAVEMAINSNNSILPISSNNIYELMGERI